MKKPHKSKAGQESVWDYPRPPRLEPTGRRLLVEFNGQSIAATTRAYRVLETSHPPAYYFPPEDIRMDLLNVPTARSTFCEFKGRAVYWDIELEGAVSQSAAWSYPDPTPAFAPLAGYLAFYPGKDCACYVDGERVQAQEGDFYGGWITVDIVGPFKGGTGTWGW